MILVCLNVYKILCKESPKENKKKWMKEKGEIGGRTNMRKTPLQMSVPFEVPKKSSVFTFYRNQSKNH